MRSNYKPLGRYIRPVDIRNTDLKVQTLLGVSIRKVLMPSIANVIGTDMKTYKKIKKNQFAYGPVTSRNGDKISVAILDEYEEAIVSQAYVVFEVIDFNELAPEYLMMWFRRPEFDRYARFKSHGSAREIFDWAEMCETELPIPSIEKQREIVAEYNTVVNRIKLNEQLNQKLEETAQALYKHWFVDFNFPITKESCPELVSGSPELEGKPYKSSGGKMVFNEELDKEIPEGWEVGVLEDVCKRITDGSHSSPASVDVGKPMASVKDMYEWGLDVESARTISAADYDKLVNGDCKPLLNDILIAKDGSFLKHIFPMQEQIEVVVLSSIAIVRPNEKMTSNFLTLYLKQDSTKTLMTTLANGGAIQRIVLKEFKMVPVLIPSATILELFENNIKAIFYLCWINFKNSFKLKHVKDVMLARMAKVEQEKELVNQN